MSRKHYQAIADAINKDLKHRVLSQDERRGAFRIIEALCYQFKADNSNFKVCRFMDVVLKDVAGVVYYSHETGFTYV